MKKINIFLIIGILGVVILNVSAEPELPASLSKNANPIIGLGEDLDSRELIDNSDFKIAKYGPSVPGDGNCNCGQPCRCSAE